MFKNTVFKPSIDTVKWAKAAIVRAVKTAAQTAIATIGTSAALGEVNWLLVGSASALAGLVSILTSIAGIPEVDGAGAYKPGDETDQENVQG